MKHDHAWFLNLILLCSLLIAFLVLRLLVVVRATHSASSSRSPQHDEQLAQAGAQAAEMQRASIVIVLGSGGHTAEMVRLVRSIDWSRYTERIYIVTKGDVQSTARALSLEADIQSGKFRIITIPRARKVHQSYLTSVVTTLWTFASCAWHVTLKPISYTKKCKLADIIVSNGPGSCVPIVVSAFLPRLLWLPSAKLVYVESLARTKRLSLSGTLVRFFVDRFFVQWESLRDVYAGRKSNYKAQVEYLGWLV